MTTTHTYDVAVVGLGAFGAATLDQLAKRGARVIGLDRYAPPHDLGSTHGETRVTRQAAGEGAAYVPLVLRSHEIWRELEQDTGRTILVANGLLLLRNEGHTCVHGLADFLGATAALAHQHDIAHELLDANALARRFPHLMGLENARGYLEPLGGYVIPEAAVTAQLERAARNGAAIKANTEVMRVAHCGDHVTVATRDETIRAGHVVVAAGGWTGQLLGAPFDRLLTLQRQVFHWYTVSTDYGDPSRAPERYPTFIWLHGAEDTGHFYGFSPLPGTREIKLATEYEVLSPSVGAINRAVSPEEGRAFYRNHVETRIRGVASEPIRSKTCFYTVTPDHGFVIDRHPESPRITVVSACSGHGFKHSAGTGEAIAETVLTGKSRLSLSEFALSRFGCAGG